jgi:long-chain acyl-CoA synthetase
MSEQLSRQPQTLADLFLQSAKQHNRKDALNYKRDNAWVSISSDEIISRAKNISLGLYSLGVKNGDRIAILAPNSPDWTITDAGCQLCGVIDVPIYTTLTPSSVEYIVNDSGSKVFFLQNLAAYKKFESVFSNCKTIEKIIFFDNFDSDIFNSISLAQLEKLGADLAAEQPNLINKLISNVKADDVATLIYTSGTTGEPKGVMLSHKNLVSNTINASAGFEFTENDKPLSVLPLSHVFERTGMYLYILNGMAVHYAESIDKVANNLKEVQPTIFVGVPRIFEKVYAKAKLGASQESRIKETIFDWAIEVGKEYALAAALNEPISMILALKYNIADRIVFAKFRDFFGGKLRFCITGGAALSNDIFLVFTGSGVPIMQGYGLTETSPVITTNTPKYMKLGTVGKPIPSVEVRIAEDGEIETFGPSVMLGYFNKPDATRDVFTSDGWFKTGDIGHLDEEGFLKITDRKKELFKTSGGKYIAPSPIEQMIKGSRFVNQVVLIGNNRKFVSALIVPDFDVLKHYAEIKELDIKTPGDFCKNEQIIDLFQREVAKHTEGLARFETVKKVALLENELTVETGEMTPTLKVKRRAVDEKYEQIIDELYK